MPVCAFPIAARESLMDPNLLDILHLPTAPQERPTLADWEACERRYCQLPSDFKEFMSTYGTGFIDGFLLMFNPAARNMYSNFSHEVDALIKNIRDCNPTYEGEYLALYPEEGG